MSLYQTPNLRRFKMQLNSIAHQSSYSVAKSAAPKQQAPVSQAPVDCLESSPKPEAGYSRLDFTLDRGLGLVAGGVIGTAVGALTGQALIGGVLGGLTGSIAVPLSRMAGLFD